MLKKISLESVHFCLGIIYAEGKEIYIHTADQPKCNTKNGKKYQNQIYFRDNA